MTDWRDGFHRARNIFCVPDGIGYFLDLYSWESILYCVFAPLFLAVPIVLLTLAFHFHFLICFLLIMAALFITFPWLIIPYWIVKKKSRHWRNVLIWSLYNACFVIGYLTIFLR